VIAVGVALVLKYSVLVLSTTTLPSSIVVHAKIHKRPSSSDSGGSGSGTDSGSGGTVVLTAMEVVVAIKTIVFVY
jgi:hypothetical protein